MSYLVLAVMTEFMDCLLKIKLFTNFLHKCIIKALSK